MTDEEMAEEWVTANTGFNLKEPLGKIAMRVYLAGLKAGRPEWHKVADGDLPKEENHYWSKIVLFQTNKGSSIIGFYDHANKAWYEKSTDDIVYGVVVWCEIPKYTEE